MGDSVYEFQVASDDVMAERTETAERVCRELRLAGLPAYRDGIEPDLPCGAEVHVDNGADALGGVTIEWLSRLENDPSSRSGNKASWLRRAGSIAVHMNTAIIGILTLAGMDARENEDDLNPPSVRVVSR